MQHNTHALVEEYLLLHKPDYHDFQSYMARSTSDGTRPNVDYRKSKLIRTHRTDSKYTQKHVTRLIELAVDDELAVDKVVYVDVATLFPSLLEPTPQAPPLWSTWQSDLVAPT